MSKILPLLLLLLVPLSGFSQDRGERKALMKSMCKEFRSNNAYIKDSVRAEIAFSKYLFPYLDKIEPSERKKAGHAIYYAFIEKCDAFKRFLARVYSYPSLSEIDGMPEVSLTSDDIQSFLDTKSFYYIGGATHQAVRVSLKNGVWINTFPDQTTARNKINWVREDEFQLTFIKSSNRIRSSMREKGDRRYYKIIKKEKNYYLIATRIPEQSQIFVFKLFVDPE